MTQKVVLFEKNKALKKRFSKLKNIQITSNTIENVPDEGEHPPEINAINAQSRVFLAILRKDLLFPVENSVLLP